MNTLSQRHLLQLGAGAGLTLLAPADLDGAPQTSGGARHPPESLVGSAAIPMGVSAAQDTSLWADRGDQPSILWRWEWLVVQCGPVTAAGLKAPALQQRLGDQAQRFRYGWGLSARLKSCPSASVLGDVVP